MIELNNAKDIVVVYGPTASGKSLLAIDMAKVTGGVIINADSAQVYNESKILSNVPSLEEQQNIPHYLFNYISILKYNSVAKWLVDVKKTIEDVVKEKKLPIVVGGSGLYLKALVSGMNKFPSTLHCRKPATAKYEELGHSAFKTFVKEIDSNMADRVDDKQRLIRAYEVYLATGKTLSEWHKAPLQQDIQGNFIKIEITQERETLYSRINARVDTMIKAGAIDEAKAIKELSNHGGVLRKIIGLSEISQYLDSSITKEEAIELIKTSTRNYCKRQQTWFKSQMKNDLLIDKTVDSDNLSILKKLFKI